MQYPLIAIGVTIAVAAIGLIIRYYFYSQTTKFTFKFAKVSAGDRVIDNVVKFYEKALDFWTSETEYSEQKRMSLELDAVLFFDDTSRTLKIYAFNKNDLKRSEEVIQALKAFQLSACPTSLKPEIQSSIPLNRTHPFILEFTTKMIEAKASIENWVMEKENKFQA